MTPHEAPRFAWNGIDPVEWLRTWQTVWRGAPTNLVQPILPGWTFNINSANSSSPQTEVDVVARFSYGRQIGRMSDALAFLIVERFGDSPEVECLADFLAMKKDVDKIKQDAAVARIEQLTKDLVLLRDRDRESYSSLRSALLAALAD
jgi:hypothetical protein